MRTNAGFAYIFLLLSIAVIGFTAAAANEIGSIQSRRSTEALLLAIGTEFQRALESYAAATPVGQPTTPSSLKDLLEDPRYPLIRRHLRKIHVDPLTGRAEWGLVRDPQGRIIGVFSLAPGNPIKQTGFPVWQNHFEETNSYSRWVFGRPIDLQMSNTVGATGNSSAQGHHSSQLTTRNSLRHRADPKQNPFHSHEAINNLNSLPRLTGQ